MGKVDLRQHPCPQVMAEHQVFKKFSTVMDLMKIDGD